VVAVAASMGTATGGGDGPRGGTAGAGIGFLRGATGEDIRGLAGAVTAAVGAWKDGDATGGRLIWFVLLLLVLFEIVEGGRGGVKIRGVVGAGFPSCACATVGVRVGAWVP
jgi:hypothetical protein